MSKTERYEANKPQEIVSWKKDPLKDLKKLASKIENELVRTDSQAQITVLGALHVGKIGHDIENQIIGSDIITTELPVDASKQGSGAPSENIFWQKVLEVSEDNNVPVGMVRNNHDAVFGIRLLEDRVRPDQKPFKSGPHFVLSSRSTPEKSPLPDELLQKLPFDAQKPQMVKVEPDLFHSLLKPHEDKFPYLQNFSSNPPVYLTQLQDLNLDEARVVVASGRWAAPHEMWLEYAQMIGWGVEDKFPAVFDLTQMGLDHLLRLRVDKTQVEGMEKRLLSILNQNEHKKIFQLTHIGGAAHNFNLIPILNEVFSGSNRIWITETLDERAVPLTTDNLTLFAQHVPLKKGLEATGFFHNQALFDIPKTISALREAISSDNELGKFYRVREMLYSYRNAVSQSDCAELDLFVIGRMLQFVPETSFDDPNFPTVDSNFIPTLASYIKSFNPGKTLEVNSAMQKYADRFQNFPLTNMAENVNITLRAEG